MQKGTDYEVVHDDIYEDVLDTFTKILTQKSEDVLRTFTKVQK
jgi:hypothetical protein